MTNIITRSGILMSRKRFIKSISILMTMPFSLIAKTNYKVKHKTKIRLIRHATLIIEINGKKILVDPMLSNKDGLDPVQNLIDKNILIFCQPNDKHKIEEQGFKNITPIVDNIVWKEISITRTKGQ